MELLQLRYFKMLAEEPHMTRVAEKLHISQSSLSKTIKLLEDELGVKLFDRQGKSLRLNENGRIFHLHIAAALSEINNARKELTDRNSTSYPDLFLYVQAGISMLPDILGGFSKQYPHIHFSISKKQYQEFDSVRRTCDFTFDLPRLDAKDNGHSVTLLEEEFLIAFPPSHWAAGRPWIDLIELKDEPFLTFIPTATYRYNTEQFCQAAGFQPNFILECHDWQTLCGFVRIGMGIAFVPKYTWFSYDNSELSLVPVRSPHCYRTINLSWDGQAYLSSSAQLFRDYVIEYFSRFR